MLCKSEFLSAISLMISYIKANGTSSDFSKTVNILYNSGLNRKEGGYSHTGYYYLNGASKGITAVGTIEFSAFDCEFVGNIRYTFRDRADISTTDWATLSLDTLGWVGGQALSLGRARDFDALISWKSKFIQKVRSTGAFFKDEAVGWPYSGASAM